MHPEMTVEAEVERLFAMCKKKLRTKKGGSFVLEALWDGDTTGWFLDLNLLAVRADGSLLAKHAIASLRYGGDIRLFNGQVPPWPETRVAQHLAERLADVSPCQLWFPSPDEPDDDNPTYVERGLAIQCADCDKLIMPPTSEFLPKDCCYHCHLRREKR